MHDPQVQSLLTGYLVNNFNHYQTITFHFCESLIILIPNMLKINELSEVYYIFS
jgi:hypothetical protein